MDLSIGGLVALLWLIASKNHEVAEVVSCPDCSELELRNANTNLNDPCHHEYEYVCSNTSLVFHEHKQLRNRIIPRTSVASKSGQNDVIEDYSEYDKEVDSLMKETSRKISENLFQKRKKYKSRVTRLPASLGRSQLEYPGMNNSAADIVLINHTFASLFAVQRNQFFDLKHKQEIRKSVLQLFQSYGLKTEVQKFKFTAYFNGTLDDYQASNLIGVLPSDEYQKPGDRIFLIGGHYDTVYRNPGIDDNGSGSIAVLECARILSKLKDKLNATVYFVLFDQEESGLEGSAAFVGEYFIPKILERYKAQFVGAYVTDMVLLHDSTPNSQTLPYDMKEMCPEAYATIKNNSNRGDFISVWSRNADKHLWQTLEETWKDLSREPDDYKLIVLNSPIAAKYQDIMNDHYYSTFLRSDHASFWTSAKHNEKYETLPAVLLCDLGPWRGYQRKCYHRPCDNTIQLTDDNLHFMAKIINAVVKSTFKLIAKENEV